VIDVGDDRDVTKVLANGHRSLSRICEAHPVGVLREAGSPFGAPPKAYKTGVQMGDALKGCD
jgi:hypothetical protein